MQTKNLRLLQQTPAHWRALIEGADIYEQRFGLRLADGVRDFLSAASPKFLARILSAESADPWRDGFIVLLGNDNLAVGTCGYKGPPGPDGVVEIGYGIAPAFQGRGFATEAAQALVAHAFNSGLVRTVRAHTSPEPNASSRVLQKCGFARIGEVIEPEDGLVWRWEKRADGTV